MHCPNNHASLGSLLAVPMALQLKECVHLFAIYDHRAGETSFYEYKAELF